MADQTSLVVIGIPLVVAALWVAYLLRPIPPELLKKEEVFTDSATGIVFRSEEGDRNESCVDICTQGELVFKAIGFTPWPVSSQERGERIRIHVGNVKELEPRTFLFRKILRFPSKLIVLSLPRPLGIVFAEDRKEKCVRVDQVLPGTFADQQQKVAQLSNASEMNAPMEGDVLRGITCTNFVFPTDALFGMNLPEKHIVVFGADGQPWRKYRSAFKGNSEDGNVTVILERPL